MAKKRGRPKKLPTLREKDFARQFQEACIPALLVDQNLSILYANQYACDSFPELEQPDGLRTLLTPDSQEECIRRIAQRRAFRIEIPVLGASQAALAVTPLVDEESDQVAGAMVLVTGGGREGQPGTEVASSAGMTALSNSLRQPLSDIFAALAVMGRKTFINQDRQYNPYLYTINQASYLLLRNVSNLVSYQRGCSDYQHVVEIVDFWGRLSTLLDACSIALYGSSIPFRYSLPEVTVHVPCCFSEIVEALMNLIDNAYHYTREGNEVAVTGKNVPGGVVVTVSDRGAGIAPEQMDKIFSPFYSMGVHGEPFVGMGMGLSVVRQNIRSNGGTIAVDSTPDVGTTVAFTLPTTDQPLTPPLMMETGTAQYLQDHFSPIYVGLCKEATLPPQ